MSTQRILLVGAGGRLGHQRDWARDSDGGDEVRDRLGHSAMRDSRGGTEIEAVSQ